jgi:hypothetical protein
MATRKEKNSTEPTNSVSRFVDIKTVEPLIGMFVYELDCVLAERPFILIFISALLEL